MKPTLNVLPQVDPALVRCFRCSANQKSSLCFNATLTKLACATDNEQ